MTVPEVSVQSSELVGESLKLRYDQPSIERAVSVVYNAAEVTGTQSLVILLVHLLIDYLKSIGREDLQAPFFSPRGARSMEAFIDAACAAFQSIAEGRLAPTLRGLEWPEVESIGKA